jgi:hypothetical protein
MPSRYRAYVEVRKSTFAPTGREMVLPDGLSIIEAWQLAIRSLQEAGLKPVNSGFGAMISTGRTCWKLDRHPVRAVATAPS